MKELRRLAQRHGLQMTERENGHVQLQGQVLVNYYPESKNRTAYVERMTGGIKHVTPTQAVDFALHPEKIPGNVVCKAKRKPSYTRHKRRMLKKHPYCFWCAKKGIQNKLEATTATVDHVIPLSKGGLDNNNNRVLSCLPCNQTKGNKMPENLR